MVQVFNVSRWASAATSPWRGLRQIACIGAVLCAAGSALAQVEVTTVGFNPTHPGRTQDTVVTVQWTRTGTSSGNFTVPVPGDFSVASLGANCTGPSPLTCTTPAGAIGTGGSTTFTLTANTVGTASLTATGAAPSTGGATATYYIQASGAVTVTKVKTTPAGDPVAGQQIEFTLQPNITGGDDLPQGATFTVTDKLPGTATDFEYINNAPAGIAPAPSCVLSGRDLTCTYTAPAGGWTVAQVNAASVVVRGRALIEGSTLSNEAVVNVEPTAGYVDLTSGDNTATVPLTILRGGDLEALGTFPATTVLTGTNHTLTISYQNNGPLPATGNGMVSTIIPAGFTIGTLPSGCSPAGNDTINGINGERINCTVPNVPASGAGSKVDFAIPLTMPGTGTMGNFPVLVAPPSGFTDHYAPNDVVNVPYTVAPPYADQSLTKSKSPTGPQAAGTVVTSTFTVTNSAGETLNYSNTQPLRVVDYMRPEEIAGDAVTVISTGWACVVTNNTDPANVARTKRVECHTTDGNGSLAVGANRQLQFSTTLAAVGAPVQLTNRACTGKAALAALGLADGVGPQPADANTANDCAEAGTDLYVTNLTDPTAAVKKYVSVDGAIPSIDAQVAADAPTLANAGHSLRWRIVITTPAAAQDTIATLRLVDAIPARVTSGASWNATNTTIAVSGPGYASTTCPATLAATGDLDCTFTNVTNNANIIVDVTMARPIRMSDTGHQNTVTLTSPDSILAATTGGALTDPAWVKVDGRFDPAVTTKTISKDRPAIGETVNFTITARNRGYENLPVGSFTVTDAINTNPALAQAAFEILPLGTVTDFDCSASNLASGAISCTNTTVLNANATRTITIPVRVKKPSGALPVNANSYLWGGSDTVLDQTNTATVTLNGGRCEWREQDTVSTDCNDAASTSNNSQQAQFAIKVPDFDMQVKIDRLHTLPVGLGDPLSYRLTMRNDGPSLAESVSVMAYLEVPPGYTLQPVMAGGNIAVTDINNAGAATGGFSFRPTGAGDVACTLIPAVLAPAPNAAPPAVSCTLSGAEGSGLDSKREVNFTLGFTLVPPAGGATGPVRIGVPAIVCASNEIDGHERAGSCRSADRAANGFNPSAATNGANYGNNYEKVNDIIFPVTDLLITKTTVTPGPVTVNQPVHYRLVVGNKGVDTPSRVRVVDTLPAGFEWIDATTVQTAITGTATLSGAVSVSSSVPPAGTQNTCWISNGVTTVALPTDRQEITCDLQGNFPPSPAGDQHTVELNLNARPKAGVYTGPYVPTDAVNESRVSPGFEDDGITPVSLDKEPANNDSNSPIQVVKASIAGNVYHDVNNNGLKEGGELPIPGVTITLTGTDSYGNVLPPMTTQTLPDGSYLFDNLPPGTYTVTETHPTTWVDGKDTVGVGATGGLGTAGNDVISNIGLNGGDAATEYNFGEFKPLPGGVTTASISGYVYYDANNDGVKDPGEQPISGVTITLTGNNGDVRSATTDANGFYQFTGLEPGATYTVVETQPGGWTDGKDTPGTVFADTGGGANDRFVVVPGSGQNGLEWNFGEHHANSGGPVGIPTLSEWGLILMSLLLGALALRQMPVRRRW